MTLIACSDFFLPHYWLHILIDIQIKLRMAKKATEHFVYEVMEYTFFNLIYLFLTTAYYNHDNN